MVGQEKLRETLNRLVSTGFPSFSIFLGAKGSGRKTLVKWLYENCCGKTAVCTFRDCSVEDVRDCIKSAYKLSGVEHFICFADADKMSPQAKNALLKITEEPPENCHFIMTLEDLNNTLPTIKSRCTLFTMEPYPSTELVQYLYQIRQEKGVLTSNPEVKVVSEVCENLEEVKLLNDYGIEEFYNYVQLVVDNIAEVSDANSFKIANKVALKQDSDGYDLKLFLKTFMTVCLSRLNKDNKKYALGTSITSYYLRQLGIKGVSKSMLVDNWIMDIRKAWCL